MMQRSINPTGSSCFQQWAYSTCHRVSLPGESQGAHSGVRQDINASCSSGQGAPRQSSFPEANRQRERTSHSSSHPDAVIACRASRHPISQSVSSSTSQPSAPLSRSQPSTQISWMSRGSSDSSPPSGAPAQPSARKRLNNAETLRRLENIGGQSRWLGFTGQFSPKGTC